MLVFNEKNVNGKDPFSFSIQGKLHVSINRCNLFDNINFVVKLLIFLLNVFYNVLNPTISITRCIINIILILFNLKLIYDWFIYLLFLDYNKLIFIFFKIIWVGRRMFISFIYIYNNQWVFSSTFCMPLAKN